MCEIQTFTVSFLKNKAKSMRENKLPLGKKMLKLLDRNLGYNEAKDEYNLCKENLNVICDKTANTIKIRSRYNWYEFGNKPIKFLI